MTPLLFSLLSDASGSARDQEILRFWFGAIDGIIPPDNLRLWFMKSAQTDLSIKRRFEKDVQKALTGEYDEWAKEPKSRLALILLLDQMTRNIYRGKRKAFSGDSKALQLVVEGIDKGYDKKLPFIYRAFFYMPLEHSENAAIQEQSVEQFRALALEAPITLKQVFDSFHGFALKHKEVIDRFGRYPHRNAILGRVSSEEEEEFLQQPGSSF